MLTPAATERASDSELWQLVRQGSAPAFETVVRRHQSLVCAVAYSYCGDLTLSEDIAQETFWAAWRERATLEQADSLRSWLCGIARNLGNNARRRASRAAEAATPLEAVAEPTLSRPSPYLRAWLPPRPATRRRRAFPVPSGGHVPVAGLELLRPVDNIRGLLGQRPHVGHELLQIKRTDPLGGDVPDQGAAIRTQPRHEGIIDPSSMTRTKVNSQPFPWLGQCPTSGPGSRPDPGFRRTE